MNGMKKDYIRKERSNKDQVIADIIQDPNVRIEPDGSVWVKRKRHAKDRPVDENGFVEGRIKNGSRCVLYYKGYMVSIPRIIYQKFIGPLDPDMEIVHLDGDSENNAVDNLEQRPDSFGAGRALRRFTESQVLAIRESRSRGTRLTDLAKQYDTSEIVISKICCGHTYQEIGGPRTTSEDLGVPKGPKSGRGKLNPKDYDELLRRRAQGETLAMLSDRFKLTRSGVSRICKREARQIRKIRSGFASDCC